MVVDANVELRCIGATMTKEMYMKEMFLAVKQTLYIYCVEIVVAVEATLIYLLHEDEFETN